nr:biotin carboxylase N-terminal domain-containing protein [Nocardioides mesophilus]
MPTIERLLVANRGEIARRVFQTCRDLGIGTVAVHSDPDAGLPFVAEADLAVRLPGSTPAQTYLRGDLVVAAALRTGADAVHPGYGFLSENADFARQVIAAGLTWVGPPPEAIEQMGSKVGAKKLVSAAGVPVLEELSPEALTAADLPVLVKASAGGGGRGMRVVRALADAAAQVERAAHEAASAFGDPTVFCEPYVERSRHVEVQVWGDHHGTEVVVLGARDCSVQRRHQKVIEEAPPPGIAEETLEAMYAAARAAALAVSYVGAGTVEFLYDPGTARFWFLEMNTRLQVEHPVTECVYGVDLVALQIEAAEGGRPAPRPGTPRGHAVEVRLYAEDPAAGWAPQSGRLTRFDVPDVAAELERPGDFGVRLDAGFAAGDEVGTHYDAMLAKLVAWAPTRAEALRRLADVLRRSRIHGLRTNRDLLVALLRHPVLRDAEMTTTFLDGLDLGELLGPADPDAVRLSAFAATVALAERAAAHRTVQAGIPVGWRNVASAPHSTCFEVAGEQVEVRWSGGRTGYRAADLDLTVLAAGPDRVVVERGGLRRTFEVHVDPAGRPGAEHVDVESDLGHVALRRTPRFADPADQVATGSLLAPMPGSVVAVTVAVGAAVVAGQPVLVLEAMKMQHTVTAPHAGTVSALAVTTGDQVSAGAVLAVVTPASPAGPTPAHPTSPARGTTDEGDPA